MILAQVIFKDSLFKFNKIDGIGVHEVHLHKNSISMYHQANFITLPYTSPITENSEGQLVIQDICSIQYTVSFRYKNQPICTIRTLKKALLDQVTGS